ncbi:type I 3-dehydroquinate dehydratase [Ornithinibacillus scapharcae]|uniref:type I 3-dehydroquinate dehydratase n=1 Tax=Ornithinibacillus scapharcae TaxID=1147159 RepID=UPI000225BC37|nr:type I 3-dehydroquinate dehydratase [Ornithinibacillus scapharcae]
MRIVKVRDVQIGEGIPKIIVPIVGRTKQEIIEGIESVLPLKPDIMEWRVDFFEDVRDIHTVELLLMRIREKLANVPLLFTFRSYREGGQIEISGDYYQALLTRAIQTKLIDLVDIELFSGDIIVNQLVALATQKGVFTVISNHDFQATPTKDEMISRLQKMQELGADIPKLAVMPKDTQDVIALLDATNTMRTKYADRPFVTISMGEEGLVSRLVGEVFGSAATFASGGRESAPGQIPVSPLRSVLEIFHHDKDEPN